MAITGIDTIDGKQIIAAGAVSAKSAEMAYNDENGNPITGYLTAVPEGYATTGDLTAYQTTAGMTAYQEAGSYLSANALDDVSGDWNRISALSGYSANGWSVKTPTTQAVVAASPIAFTASGIPQITGYLTVSSAPRKWCTITDGGIYMYNIARGNSAQAIRPDTIFKWNNYASGKLDTTATANFYTTANESGFITGVPDTYLQNTDLTITDGKISEISGVPLSAGSAPTYGYTDNDLISSIDTSGLYATSALEAVSANVVKDHGTLGYDLSSYLSQNTSYFYWMPSNSPWTTADYATGIFSPLQYATGACLAMNNPATFKAYYKGNEWFVSNTVSNVGQMLRGEVHKTRGVHISGATTAGYGFDLNISGVSGVNSNGSWKYGPAEDAALRAVSSCDMHESAFEYDASDNITGYNGSAFAGGGSEFPQSATEAIETVTANSADWNGTTETVSSNSGAWGGSALPISAGPGIKFEMVDNTLVASVDETVLFFAGNDSSGAQTGNLTESIMNFERIRVVGMDNDGHVDVKYIYPAWTKNADGFSTSDYEVMLYGANPFPPQSTVLEKWTKYSFRALTSFNLELSYEGSYTANSVNIVTNNHKNSIREVVGINRIAGGN